MDNSTQIVQTSKIGSQTSKNKLGEIETIAPGLLRILLPVPFPPGSVGVLAMEDHLDGRDVWTIVDTGLISAKSDWRRLLEGPLKDRPIGRVVVTHHHPDHIGLAGWFQSEFGVELWTTRTAWLFARMLQLDATSQFPEERERFFHRCGYDDAQKERARLRGKIGYPVIVAPMPLGYRRISEGDELTIGDRRWRVLVGNGHAPEHALLLCAQDKMLIAGDQILPRITPNIGVYPTEPDDDPLGAWLNSCAELSTELDDDLLVLPGHGAPFRGARTRLREIVDEHHDGLSKLEEHLKSPRRVVDCFGALYKREIKPELEGLATAETLSHLNYLTAQGRAVRETDNTGVYWWRAK